MRNNILFILLLLYYQIEFLFLKIIFYKKENSILIVRLDAIGDSIVWLDSAKEYKQHFPCQKLVLLCNIAWKEIAEKLPYFDEVICLDRNKFQKKIGYRLKFLQKITKRKFEKVINPVFSRDFFVQDLLIHNIRGKEKVGYKGNYRNTENTLLGFGPKFVKYTNVLEGKANKWYSLLIEAERGDVMELSRNADFIRKYLDKDFKSSLPKIPFSLPNIDAYLLPKEYIVLFVGASTNRRLWSAENYTKLINLLNIENIVVCGGRGEERIWTDIEKCLDGNKLIINLIGKTSLLEMFTVIKQAKYIITNETSASHITVAVRTPSVCLLGGTHFGRFQPYIVENITNGEERYLPKIVYNKMNCFNCNNKCPYIKDKNTVWPCIESITVEQVYEKVLEIEKDLELITE